MQDQIQLLSHCQPLAVPYTGLFRIVTQSAVAAEWLNHAVQCVILPFTDFTCRTSGDSNMNLVHKKWTKSLFISQVLVTVNYLVLTPCCTLVERLINPATEVGLDYMFRVKTHIAFFFW